MRHRLEYWLVALAAFVIRLLPWRVLSAAGEWVGLGFFALGASRRQVALGNLARAFPERRPSDRARIARRVFRHFGRMLFELLKFSALSPDQMLARVEVEGVENGREAYAAGNGVFFLTAHFGSWEVDGLIHALVLAPIGVMARRLDNPRLDAMLERIRQGTGNWVIYRSGGIRRALRALEAGQGVAILIDQHVLGADATTVDFFGRPAATTTALAALALRTGAPVVPVFSIPTAPGRYRIVYERQVERPSPDTADPIREFTGRCTAVLETYVRQYPELWLWMHRRWRDPESTASRPDADA